ncbi:MAG: PAS domain-containing sensor histidine kinase [Bacteroidetes bacterium]|nr:PAS domain-containing sensor histidine kinase [Bacteroidota bacterium]
MDSKEGLHALFAYATEGILITNSKGEITKINPSAERLFGYDEGELVGKKIELLVPQKYRGNHTDHRAKYNTNPHPRSMGKGMTLFGVRKDGKEFPVEISLSNYTTNDELYVIAFIIDITERKQAEEKLKSYSTELEKRVEDRTLMLREAIAELEKTKEEIHAALEKEKELNDLKSRFVSMASHEFRTPLSTILSSVSLISKYNSPDTEDKKQKHISRVKSSVSHLTDLLNDFLSLGKLEEGVIKAAPQLFNIVEFSKDVIVELQVVAKEGQQIKYEHTGSIQEVYLDNKLLRNIYINLLSNAIKFSPENGLILINTEVDERFMRIEVIDSGIGISKEDQVHLFERFFRAQNATNIQGTGLGLNIVAKYVELMGGEITFTSELNKGTTFSIKFPLELN